MQKVRYSVGSGLGLGLSLVFICLSCQACGGPCGQSFEDYIAFALSGVHLDHVDPATKTDKTKQPSHHSKDPPSQAVIEWAKCESFCSCCHDLGVKETQKKVPKIPVSIPTLLKIPTYLSLCLCLCLCPGLGLGMSLVCVFVVIVIFLEAFLSLLLVHCFSSLLAFFLLNFLTGPQ